MPPPSAYLSTLRALNQGLQQRQPVPPYATPYNLYGPGLQAPAPQQPQQNPYDIYGPTVQQPAYPLPAAPQPAGPQPLVTPEEEESIARKAGNVAVGGLSAVGNFLDLPGSMVRDVLALKNPLDQWLSPFSPENRVHGRDLLRQYGMVGPQDRWGNWWGGLAAEIALDPLTYLSLGAAAATKFGRAAQKAGLTGKWAMSRIAGDKLGKFPSELGTAYARQNVGLGDLVRGIGDQAAFGLQGAKATAARKKALRESLTKLHTAGKGIGLTKQQIRAGIKGNEQLFGTFGWGLPFKAPKAVTSFPGGPDWFNKLLQKVPGVNRGWAAKALKLTETRTPLDIAAHGIRYTPVVGQALRHLDPVAKGAQTKVGRNMARGFREMEEQWRSEVTQQVDQYINELAKADPKWASDKYADDFRKAFEIPGSVANEPAQVNQLIRLLRAQLADRLKTEKYWGSPIEKLSDPEIKHYLARYYDRELAISKMLTPEGRMRMQARLEKIGGHLQPWNPSELRRKQPFWGIPGGTVRVKDLARSALAWRRLQPQGQPGIAKDLAAYLKKNFPDIDKADNARGGFYLDPADRALVAQGKTHKYTAKGKEVKIKKSDRWLALAKELGNYTDATLESGIFGNHPLLDFESRMLFGRARDASNRLVFQALAEELTLGAARPSGTLRGEGRTIGALFAKIRIAREQGVNRLLDVLPGQRQAYDDLVTQYAGKDLVEAQKEFKTNLLKRTIDTNLYRDITRFREQFTAPATTNFLLEFLDNITNFYKMSFTGPWPGFQGRNLFSGQAANVLVGTWSARSVLAAHRLMRGRPDPWLLDIPIVQQHLEEHFGKRGPGGGTTPPAGTPSGTPPTTGAPPATTTTPPATATTPPATTAAAPPAAAVAKPAAPAGTAPAAAAPAREAGIMSSVLKNNPLTGFNTHRERVGAELEQALQGVRVDPLSAMKPKPANVARNTTHILSLMDAYGDRWATKTGKTLDDWYSRLEVRTEDYQAFAKQYAKGSDHLFQASDLIPRHIQQLLAPDELESVGRKDVAYYLIKAFQEGPPLQDWKAAAAAGAPAKEWYTNAARLIHDLFQEDANRFAAILGATSPNNRPDVNLRWSLRIWDRYLKANRPEGAKAVERFVEELVRDKLLQESAHKNNVRHSLLLPDGVVPDLSGQKVNAFARNLLGEYERVALDRWMAIMAGVSETKFKALGTYLGKAAKVRWAARELGMNPAQAQASIWSFLKVLSALRGKQLTGAQALRRMSQEAVAEAPGFVEQLLRDPQTVNMVKALGPRYGDALSTLQQAYPKVVSATRTPIDIINQAALGRVARLVPPGTGSRAIRGIDELALFQSSKDAAKAAVRFEQDGRAVMYAFRNADMSSFLHETAHIFRRHLGEMDQSLLSRAEQAIGVKPGTPWTREQEEVFARGFERYLRTGKAPTSALEEAFRAFKRWLTKIYQRLKGSPIEQQVHPDLRKVFDEMLGGEAAPAAAAATPPPTAAAPPPAAVTPTPAAAPAAKEAGITSSAVKGTFKTHRDRVEAEALNAFAGVDSRSVYFSLALADAFAGMWAGARAGRTAEDFFKKLNLSPGQTHIELHALHRRGADLRGQIRFFASGNYAIHGFRKAREHTLPHELAHLFKDHLHEIDPSLLRRTEEALGIRVGRIWTQAQEEDFARGFERYLRTGRAPTNDLVEVFNAFKEWLTQIYRTLVGSPIWKEVHPDLRKVFDEMLGGEATPAAVVKAPAKAAAVAAPQASPALASALEKLGFPAAPASFAEKSHVTNALQRGGDTELAKEYLAVHPDPTLKEIADTAPELTEEWQLFPWGSHFEAESVYGKDALDYWYLPVEELDSAGAARDVGQHALLVRKKGLLTDTYAQSLQAGPTHKTGAPVITWDVLRRASASTPAKPAAPAAAAEAGEQTLNQIDTLYQAIPAAPGYDAARPISSTNYSQEHLDRAMEYIGELVHSRLQFAAGLDTFATHVVGQDISMEAGRISERMGGLYGPGKPGPSVKDIAGTYIGRPPEGAPPTSWDLRATRGVGGRRRSDFPPARAGDMAGHWVEGMNRISPFLKQLREGVSPEEAARIVGGAQVMYQNKYFSPFEREYLQRAFPFYKFTARQLPHLFDQLHQHPGGMLAQMIRGLNRARRPEELTPDYVAETASIPMGTLPEGSKRYATGFGFMFEDPLQFFGKGTRGAGLEALSRLHPLAKAPMEWTTGQTFFQQTPLGGRSLEDLDPVLGRIGANLTGREYPYRLPRMLELAASNSPAARLLTSIRTATDPRKWEMKGIPIPPAITQLTTGFRVTDVSPAAQDAILRERGQELMRVLGSKTFVKTYFPAEMLEEMTPEERAAAQQLQNLMTQLARRRKLRVAEKRAQEAAATAR